ncbi:hypothetical protein [Acidaminobacterium chupaoyuni]
MEKMLRKIKKKQRRDGEKAAADEFCAEPVKKFLMANLVNRKTAAGARRISKIFYLSLVCFQNILHLTSCKTAKYKVDAVGLLWTAKGKEDYNRRRGNGKSVMAPFAVG